MINFDFNSDLLRYTDLSIPVLDTGISKEYIGNPFDTNQKVGCNINLIFSNYGNYANDLGFTMNIFNIMESDTLNGVYSVVDDIRLTGDIDLIRSLSVSGSLLLNIYKIGVTGTKRYIKVNFTYDYSLNLTSVPTIQTFINYSFIPTETK